MRGPEEMTFHFGQLIAHVAKTRNGCAPAASSAAAPSATRTGRHGYSCVAEKRAIETIEDGAPKTDFMRFGDHIRIDMKGTDGMSLFGAIEQVVAPNRPQDDTA